MNFQSVIKGLAISDRRGRFETEVTGIAADSRSVRPGDVFVAVRGQNHDGHQHIGEAIERGAVAVVAERWDESFDEVSGKLDVVLVSDTRRALGPIAANFFGQPSRKLHVAGVTGTNGKTTVTYVLESIIRAAGRKVGVIGTVEARYDHQRIALGHTTPGPIELQRLLAEMVEARVNHVVLEVSSHALDQSRTAGVHFKVAAFTNLSQDHLDYHASMDDYFEAKALLFSQGLRRSRARGRMAVVSVDDSRGPEMMDRWGGKTLRVSTKPEADADVVVADASYGLEGTWAKIRTSKGEWEIRTALIGPHNLSNVCVAVGIALAMGFSKVRILRGLEALERVPGRLERVPDERHRVVFVDYAHTPDALAQVLDALRPHVEGRLVVVWGAGGNRDADKRPAMGQAVAERADVAIVTTDNPRNENPETIAQGLVEGLERGGLQRMNPGSTDRGFFVELDRQAAIRSAVDLLRDGDVLLLAGKGHETVQIVGERRYRFDDRAIARRALEGQPEAELELIEDRPKPRTRGVTSTELVGHEDVIEEAFEVEEQSIEASEEDGRS